MTSKTRSFRPSPALVIALVALFAALSGSAIAAGIAKNSVRSAQIVDGTVRTIDLHDSAVNSTKVADQSLTANDLGPDSVGSEEIAENAVGSSEVAPDSLTAGDLAANSVTSSEVADNSLTAADLAPASVRSSELGPIVVRTSNPQAIAAGASGSVSIECAPGETLISGGGQPANFGVEMTSSRPSGNGWLYQAKNNNGAPSTLTAFALCLAN
jgi:hypothetical protein